MDHKNTGILIKQLRERSKLSQQQLADKLYIDRTLVNKWENGKSVVTPANLIELKKILNI